MFPVSGAEQLSASGRRWAAAGDLGQRGVVEVGEALGPLGGVRQEEVPQPALAGLGLQLVEDRGVVVGVARLRDLAFVQRLVRVDPLVHEVSSSLWRSRDRCAGGEVHGRTLDGSPNAGHGPPWRRPLASRPMPALTRPVSRRSRPPGRARRGAAQLGIVAPGAEGAAAVLEPWSSGWASAACRSCGSPAAGSSATTPWVRWPTWSRRRPARPGDPAVRRVGTTRASPASMAGPAALVVEDAQWLDPASLRVVVGVVERAAERSLPLVVSPPPGPGRRRPGRARRRARAAASRWSALGPLDENRGRRAGRHRPRLGGRRAVVDGRPRAHPRHARAGRAAAGRPGSRPAPGRRPPGGRRPGPPAAAGVAALRAEVDQLPRRPHGAGGAERRRRPRRRAAAATTDRRPRRPRRRHRRPALPPGWWPRAEDVVPLVAAAVTEMTPRPTAAGSTPGWPAAGGRRRPRPPGRRAPGPGRGPRAPRPRRRRRAPATPPSSRAMSPELAPAGTSRAIAAGARRRPGALAARRAEAAALDGDAVTALRLADGVVGRPRRRRPRPGAGRPRRALPAAASGAGRRPPTELAGDGAGRPPASAAVRRGAPLWPPVGASPPGRRPRRPASATARARPARGRHRGRWRSSRCGSPAGAEPWR